MELLECLQQLSVHELSQTTLKNESSLFLLYALVCFLIRKPVYLLAFFMCFFLVNAEITQSIKEYQVYLIIIVIYSFVFDYCSTRYSKYCCVILVFISVVFSVDAFLYGTDGYYGASETVIYNNIDSIALYAHLLFIGSLVYNSRIYNNIQRFLSCVERITHRGYNMQYILFTLNEKGDSK